MATSGTTAFNTTIWIIGYVDGSSGFWRSIDAGNTWTQITGFPSLDFSYNVIGDETNAKVFWLPMGSSGLWRYQMPYLLKRDLDPASNDNSPAFLEKVA